MELDADMKSSMSEYIGYQYGIINESMRMLDLSFHNLTNVLNGGLDSLDHGARGMYITIWYNMALESIRTIDDGCEELTMIESEMVERVMGEDEAATIFRGYCH